jgi:hypothetical protein
VSFRCGEGKNAFVAACGRRGVNMLLDTGASMPVVSRGYLKEKGLWGLVTSGAKHEVQTADEKIISTERLVADFKVMGAKRVHFFRMEVIVLPTENLIPFLFPLEQLTREKATIDFESGVTVFHPKDPERRFEMQWEQCDGGMVAGVEVFQIVQGPKRVQGKNVIALAGAGNGRSPS